MIELIIVLSILVIISVIILRSFSSFRAKQSLNTNAIQITSLLNDARTATINSKESSKYGVHFESDRAVYFKGTTFSEPSSYNKEIQLDGSVTISPISLQGGAVDAVFEQLTGETSNYGSVTLTASSNSTWTKVITISQTGIVTHN